MGGGPRHVWHSDWEGAGVRGNLYKKNMRRNDFDDKNMLGMNKHN